jgi:hypothetical protein
LERAAIIGDVRTAMQPPHFLCIGAHKSGTTWLYENLKRHPAVWLPPIKELHFFDGMPGLPKVAKRLNEAIAEVVASGQVADPAKLDMMRRYVLEQPKDFAWYRSLFAPAGDRVTGDMTPAYGTLPAAAVAKIRELLPDCRIIFIMRNPIDRAWSHFRSNAGTMGLDRVGRGFEAFRRHFDSASSQSRTAYTRTIATWEQHFSRDRILYLFYDDLLADPEAFLGSVCSFLGIASDMGCFADTRDRLFHRSIELEMEPEVRVYLARKYEQEILGLHERFGGHATRWLKACEEAIREYS